MASTCSSWTRPEDNGFVGVHNVKKVATQAWELCEFLRDTEERNTVKRWMLATRIEIVTSARLAAREPV